MTLKMKKTVLTRAKTLDFLKTLTAITDETYRTLYLPPHLLPTDIDAMLKEAGVLAAISNQLSDIAVNSSNGAVIINGTDQTYLIVPPFPVAENRDVQSLDVTPLQSLLDRKYNIGIVLVRLGSYAVGVCRGDRLVSSKAGTGLVHGRHHKGGSSAHRFERHRDKQIESFLIRVCGYVREQLEPYLKTLDYIIYGGARTTILTLQKYCPLLEKLEKPVLPPLLNIPDPRRAVLESAVSRIWSSTIYSWTEG